MDYLIKNTTKKQRTEITKRRRRKIIFYEKGGKENRLFPVDLLHTMYVDF